ncbi:MAG: pyrimidine reductase, partial [Candidatus Promineifilaceae bacterium]
MEEPVLQLYPLPSQQRPLKGLYLAHDLREQEPRTAGRPTIYSNFVTSLDGRIAIPHPSRPGMMVPKTTANERDWRLFQELATQADLIISSGRYLRDWADGRAQE